MNRWFYRAVGTVGLAGGFLLLGTGAAQAGPASDTEMQRPDTLLGDALSVSTGLTPLLQQPAGIAGGLPVVGDALAPVTDLADVGNLAGVGNLPGQIPLVGQVTGAAAGGLPVVDHADRPAAPSARPGAVDPTGRIDPADPAATAAESPDATHIGHRPVAGDDPMFTESAELAPSAELATLGELDVFETATGAIAMLHPVPIAPAALPLD